MRTIIRNATIVNEGRKFVGSVVIEDEMIQQVLEGDDSTQAYDLEIDATGLGYFLNHPSHLSLITPKNASPKMLLFIFDTPSTRLTKMTGTSLILKPHL